MKWGQLSTDAPKVKHNSFVARVTKPLNYYIHALGAYDVTHISTESNETAPAISGRGFGRPSSLPKDRTCMATDCQSMLTFNLKCPPDFGELAAFEYGCPDNQAKYLCCSGNCHGNHFLFGNLLQFPISLGMEPVPDLASECSVSECTSTLTREVKCPGTHEMGQLEYGCEENQAKFVCCPGKYKNPLKKGNTLKHYPIY